MFGRREVHSPQEARASERRLGLLAALVIFNVVVSTSFQDALFLSNHRRDRIPVAMLLGSLITAAITIGLNPLLRRLSPAGALRVILVGLALASSAAAAWNIHPSGTSTFALFLFVEMATTLGVAATWTYFQAPLEPSQMRRLLPRLGTWAGIGGLVAGTLIPVVMRGLATPQVLVAVSALAWFAAPLLVSSAHRPKDRRPHKRRGAAGGLRRIFGVGLMRWMILGTAGIIWVGLLLQYQTRVALQQTMSPPEIAQLMGALLAVASIAGIGAQAFITTPILDRWGVGLGLAVLPALVAILLGCYLLAPVVWFIAGALFVDKTLRPNLHRPAESCLMGALSPGLRPTLFLALGGILAPLLKAVGALGLWGFAATVPPAWVSGTALGLTAGLVLLSTRWGSFYARALRETLEEGSFELSGPGEDEEGVALIPLIDGPRLRMLLKAIDTGTPRSRALALEMLLPHRQALVSREMWERTRSPFEPVRIAALRWLAVEPSRELEAYLQARWAEASILDDERIALIQAAGPMSSTFVGQDLHRYLSSPNLDLRSAVIRSLIASPEPLHQQTGRRCVEVLLRGSEARERSAGLRLVQEYGGRDEGFLQAVHTCLPHPDLGVRREAVACLPSFADPKARASLFAALREPDLAHVAVRGLMSCGMGVVGEIIAMLEARATPPLVRLHLARALGLIRSIQGIPSLLGLLRDGEDRALQLESLKSLYKLRGPFPQAQLDEALLHEFVLRELRLGLRLLDARDVLGAGISPAGLLRRELDEQISTAQARVYRALALLSPPNTMVHIFHALRSPGSQNRDQARELLRTLFRPGPLLAGSLKLLDEGTSWSDECFRPPLMERLEGTPLAAARWLLQTGDRWMVSALRHDPDAPPVFGGALGPWAPSTSPSPSAGQTGPQDQAEDPMDASLETILFLKDVTLFEELTNQQLVEVARLAEKIEVPSGRTLCREGDVPDYLYLVRQGKLRVIVADKEVARLGRGECAGEMAVLSGSTRTATMVTDGQCQLLRFEGDHFLQLIDTFPEIGRAMIKSLVRRLERTGATNRDKRGTMTGMIVK